MIQDEGSRPCNTASLHHLCFMWSIKKTSDPLMLGCSSSHNPNTVRIHESSYLNRWFVSRNKYKVFLTHLYLVVQMILVVLTHVRRYLVSTKMEVKISLLRLPQRRRRYPGMLQNSVVVLVEMHKSHRYADVTEVSLFINDSFTSFET